MGCEGMVRVFKIGRGWEGRGSFPHSSFFKTLNFFIYLLLLLFFLQNTISVPTSSPTVQESLTLRRGWGRVGSGGLVQESAGRRGGERV